jgi:spore maturation protein CgeB
MKILFIGQCEYGSTSRMRYEVIQNYANSAIQLLNLTPIIQSTWKPFRSIGWRFKFGPLIYIINKVIKQNIDFNEIYDLIWIENGVFIKVSTLNELRTITRKLVHFTPDPAFLFHWSRHFKNGLKIYDFCITTKTFELDLYLEYGCKKIIYCTQGFDENIHKPVVSFENKSYDVCFVGHHELERERILNQLLHDGFTVALAGINWNRFVKRNKNYKNLFFFGNHVAGEKYALLISQSKFGLGLLSKWIPEMHTTRTMEIPACGTVLVTEKNLETSSMFNDNDVVFYDDIAEIPRIIDKMLGNEDKVRLTSENGCLAINNGGFSHKRIVCKLLDEIFDDSVVLQMSSVLFIQITLMLC